MSLTSTTNIRLTGGINEADAHLLFRVADETALNTEITRALAIASAKLRKIAPSSYTGSVTPDADLDTLFTRAEELLSMQLLTLSLRNRKILGTHFPYDQEESSRFDEVIATAPAWQAELDDLIGQFLEVEDELPFAYPVLATNGVLLPLDHKTQGELASDLIVDSENMPRINLG